MSDPVLVFDGIDALRAVVGTRLGCSSWHTVDQGRIDAFAEATGDHQWIHVEPVRAADGPFGATIAHGYLTLAMVPELLSELYRIDGFAMSVNYGANRLRFPSAVVVGSQVRAVVDVVDLIPGERGHQLVLQVVVELRGSDKPACAVELISMLVP